LPAWAFKNYSKFKIGIFFEKSSDFIQNTEHNKITSTSAGYFIMLGVVDEIRNSVANVKEEFKP